MLHLGQTVSREAATLREAICAPYKSKISKAMDDLNQNNPKWKAQSGMNFSPAYTSRNYFKVSLKWVKLIRLSIWNHKSPFSFNLLSSASSLFFVMKVPHSSPFSCQVYYNLSFELFLRFSGLLLLRYSVNISYFVPFLFKTQNLSTQRDLLDKAGLI